MAKNLTEMTDEQRNSLVGHLKDAFIAWAEKSDFAGSSDGVSIYSELERAVGNASGKLGWYSLVDLMKRNEEMNRFRRDQLVTVDRKNQTIDLLDPVDGTRTDDDPYWIRFDRIDTPEKVLGWLVHLHEKTWFTVEHMRLLIWAADSHARKSQKSFVDHSA
jgi:hypothetical protein